MSIKVIGICGSPIKEGNTAVFLKEALKAAKDAGGAVTTEFVYISDQKIADCLHCNWCTAKQEAGKFCAIQDGMSALYPKLLEADIILLASPVYMGRLSGYMAVALDRLRCLIHGNHYHMALKDKVGGALAVGWFRDGGAQTTLITLFNAFTALGMIPLSPPGISFYGAIGIAGIEGTGKQNPKDMLGVLHDDRGLKSARAIGKRVVEIARLLKKAR